MLMSSRSTARSTSTPGSSPALFELALPARLLTKGFTPAAFDGPRTMPTTTHSL
jgi:hypothetical protein